MFGISISDGKAMVSSPYNPDFVSKIKALGGKWSPVDKIWVVPEEIIEDVRNAMVSVYGRDDRSPVETVDVLITFNSDVDKYRGPVVMFGHVIASAFGRDSGATIGENTSFIEGKPESGGSVKNWRTTIPAGCVVKLLRVPKALVDGFDSESCPCDISIKVLDSKIDREALMSERARLLARIREIDSLLMEVT